ncbi:hypothetical protein C8R32_104122 [Nitrosospira sp. Nsp5]|uniref:Uncharacterized protein n=1 Tax=Nitrosospira multiformis TaxID=1231 RepID=A0ABY0TEX4_9PROT|nr:hypothetical protein C8R32_104122 [Nitrosospira sp. Nsp5]SDQ69652.1 hypothetical protein SAMN05216402_1901 [Nitrosospira multiformis]
MLFFGVRGKAQRRGMRPRRAEQCLPQEGATPKRDAGAPCTWNAIAAFPTLPDPRFAGPLVRRFGAPLHSKKLQRSHVPQKLCNSPRSGPHPEGESQIIRNIVINMTLIYQMSGQLPDLGSGFSES